jgi:predicted small secreted protein
MIMFRNVMLSMLLVTVCALIGCETTKGAGKDIENTGQNIQEGVDRNR